MNPEITPEFSAFLHEWAITLAIAGGVCLVFGTVVGWIIWRNTRKFTEKLEKENREAFHDFEQTSDEISKIKASIMDAVD